jgi:hypothetical protein
MQLTVADLKGRIAWLDRGLAKEVGLQRGAEDVLLFRERRQYLAAVQDALAGADAARFGEIPLPWQEKGPSSLTAGAILTNPSRPLPSPLT